MRTLAALLLVGGLAWSQQQDRQNRGSDFWVNLLKDRLGLTEEQAGKVREILAKDAEDRAKLEEARTAKINELLNEEQKKQYADLRGGRGFGGGGQGGQGFRGFGGGNFGGGQMPIEDLKRELSLTDEQVEKVRPILDEFGEAMRKRFEDLRQGGFQGLNLQDEMRKFQDSVKEYGDKVKAHLNDDQKKKYDELVESRMQGLRALQGLGGLLGAQRQAGPAPRASVDERVRRAMDALKVENEAERTAIADLVRKVVQAQHDLEDYGKAAREKLAEASKNRDLSDAAIEDRLKEHLEERRTKEKTLLQLQKELSEILTDRQELELIAQSVLK